MARKIGSSTARRTIRQLAYGSLLVVSFGLITAQGAPEIEAGIEPLRLRALEFLILRGEAASNEEGVVQTAWTRLTRRGEKDRRIRELEARVRELSRYEMAAVTMAYRLELYEDMLKAMGEMPARGVTARVVREVDGPFSETRLANAGADQGVEKGSVALNEAGLVGQVIEVGRRSSRILLVTDYNSRVPVVGEVSGVRAIMYGERDGDGMLTDLPERDDFRSGERILTSGEGGMFPTGLPVGRAYRQGEAWRVALAMTEGSALYVRLVPKPVIAKPEDDPVPAADATANAPEGAMQGAG